MENPLKWGPPFFFTDEATFHIFFSSQTLLAAYYSVCDVILIYQYFYYKKYYVNGIRISSQSQGASETTPLLNGQPAGAEENPNASSISHARSHREEPQDFKRECLKYSFAVLLVSFTGVAAWLISRWRNGDEIPGDQPLPPARPGFRWDAQAAGWASAVLYRESTKIREVVHSSHAFADSLSLLLLPFSRLQSLRGSLRSSRTESRSARDSLSHFSSSQS